MGASLTEEERPFGEPCAPAHPQAGDSNMIAIIAGGRNYEFSDSDREFLDLFHDHYSMTCVVIGDARGADAEAREWAYSRGLVPVVFHANWDRLGKAAGPIRNQQMIYYVQGKQACGLLIAFPGGKGTADMIRRAKAAHFQVAKPSRRG